MDEKQAEPKPNNTLISITLTVDEWREILSLLMHSPQTFDIKRLDQLVKVSNFILPLFSKLEKQVENKDKTVN